MLKNIESYSWNEKIVWHKLDLNKIIIENQRAHGWGATHTPTTVVHMEILEGQQVYTDVGKLEKSRLEVQPPDSLAQELILQKAALFIHLVQFAKCGSLRKVSGALQFFYFLFQRG